MTIKRRTFLKKSQQFGLGLGLIGVPVLFSSCKDAKEGAKDALKETKDAVKEVVQSGLKISLAQWSLNKAIFGGDMDNLDFAAVTKNKYGIEAIEYVNQFFKDKAEDAAYLKELNKRADDNGVKQLLIMIDREGDLGNLNDKERMQ
ncbi:MAG: sugar phosphate isomerase/epimerase, partial [Bacteroidota bacterium]